jgi:hypothetical protein
VELGDELSDENGTESQQNITKNISPDLRRTQDQGRIQGTTEEPRQSSENTQQMSLQNNLDLALMDNRGPQILSWNREAQVVDLESGSSSSLQHGGGQIEFGGMGILAGLFDVAQDPFLSHSEQAWRYSTLERSTERSGRYRQVLGNIGNGTFQSFQNGRGRAKMTGVGLPHHCQEQEAAQGSYY